MSRKHCCVVGGTGFIGGRVVRRLLAQGRTVTVIGRSPGPSRPLPDEVRYVSNAGDEGLFKEVFSRDQVNEVIDLAYSSVPKTSYDDPVHDILNNLPNVVNMLAAASAADVDRFILVSSGGTVYGCTDTVPIQEAQPTDPISPYGITKLATEKYAGMYGSLEDLDVICLRPANAYGEGQRPFVQQGFVATAIASVLQGREIPLYGEHGTVRDYIHVDDVAGGIAAALEHGTRGACYNIGTGQGRSNRDVLDVIASLAEPAGFSMKIESLPARGFDVPVNILDSSKLSDDTGWRPDIPFADGLKRTWNWFVEQGASS